MKRLRAQVYWWLERPDRRADGPRYLELALIILIIANVGSVIIESVDTIYERWKYALEVFENISLGIFAIEYLTRFWVVPENPENRSRLSWALTPFAIIDLLAILPMLLAFFFPIDLRILRIFRLLRLFKLTRYSVAAHVLLDVIEEESSTILAGLFILFLMLVLAASGAWMTEHKVQPEAFGSIPAAMWWAVVTLTTVGYGDVTPITVGGKIFGGLVAIIGIGIAALPAGILSSGMTRQLKQRRENLRYQFQTAIADGNICAEDEMEIEKLRRELGMSRREVEGIRREISAARSEHGTHCPHCGHSLQMFDS